MRKKLRVIKGLWHYGADGTITAGPNPNLTGHHESLYGDCTNLRGNCSFIWGNCSSIAGDCTGVYGDCTGLYGNIDSCKLTPIERANEVNICSLVAE